jgi:hypothetical protein
MTPVRVRRGLDVTSLAIGIATTLVVVGLGFGVVTYTASRSTPEDGPKPRTAPPVVHAKPAAPAPQPAKPSAANPSTAKPIVKPEIAPAPRPVVAAPDPAPALAPASASRSTRRRRRLRRGPCPSRHERSRHGRAPAASTEAVGFELTPAVGAS